MTQSLRNPPINEVICGFMFDGDVGLTPTEVGLYWASRQADLPNHEIKETGASLVLGIPPLRTWLITSDGTRLVQVQSDRVFVNWRRQADSDAYPRFTTETEGGEPLLPYALREFERLEAFLVGRGKSAGLGAIELSKVDVIRRGQHWDSYEDLAAMLPILRGSFPPSEHQNVLFRFETDLGDDARRSVTIASGEHRPTKQPVIRLEVRIRRKVQKGEALKEAFTQLDEAVDSTFFSLLSPFALERFGAIPGA
jgi:uncharacterized protein (TIGR04255 family)